MSRGRKPEKSRKKLAYIVLAVIFILVCFFAFSFLRSSPPQAAIVDHLSFFPEQRNQTFVDTTTRILEETGLTCAYYKGEEITVDFYRKLPSRGSDLIILRVHSAIMKTEEGVVSLLGLFTSELYSSEAAQKYPEDIENDRLVRAFFPGEDKEYFGIVPRFVEESMEGRFRDTVIIMMGCEGLGYVDPRTHTRVAYNDMAEAFVKKGAKVYTSWDGPVGIDHTDLATAHLLRSLTLRKRTLKEAVDQTNYYAGPDPTYNSTLKFYPDTAEVGNYVIPNLKGSLTVASIYTASVLRKPKDPDTRVKPLW